MRRGRTGRRRVWQVVQYGLSVAALLFCSACGTDYPDPPPEDYGYLEGPNQGSGWIGFTYPNGPYETTEETVAMGGMTFIPTTATCPNWKGDLGNNYQVTWFNDANGLSGRTTFGLNCATYVFAWWKAPLGIIPLEPGENHITITADDGLGNSGKATMTVTRVQ